MQAKVLIFTPMTKHLEAYPNRIRELRTAAGLTQQQLGDLVGMSDVHIGYIELGRRELRLPAMKAIARVLGVAVADLLSREDNPLISSPRSRRLLENWLEADEAGRQAIERVAESLSGFTQRPDDIPQPWSNPASAATPQSARKARKK